VAHYVTDGVGYADVLGTVAQPYFLNVEKGDGTTVQVTAWCIDVSRAVNTDPTVDYVATSRAAESLSAGVGRAGDIAARHASIGTVLTPEAAENTAVQLAEWNLANATDFSAVNNAAIKARATALVAAANDLAEGPTGLSVTATAAYDKVAKDVAVTAVVVDAAGAPLAGQPITVTSGTVTKTSSSGPDGKAVVELPATKASAEATVTVEGSLAVGTLLVPASGQRMVLGEPVPLLRSATVTTPATPVAAPVATPTKAPVVTPPKTKPPVKVVKTPVKHVAGPELPNTGVNAPVGLGILALLAAAGIGGTLVLRRRRANQS
jgi:LPXTG-motif cell wall-anchored protein